MSNEHRRMTNPDEWTTWLAANPPPDLHQLVAHWAGYEKIPEQAWDEFQTAKAAWEDRRMTRLYGSREWTMTKDRQRKPGKSQRKR